MNELSGVVPILNRSDIYKIEDREYVRKADVDEEHKEAGSQGLKDQLVASDEPEGAELREEIDETVPEKGFP
jgi:hypothetical protein